MQGPVPSDTTSWLLAAGRGDQAARERLFVAVYDELRSIASGMLAGRGGTLQPTALVHEAFLRLVDQTRLGSQDRAHFVCIAARAMRFSLRDHWRRRQAGKRGGSGMQMTLDNHEPVAPAVEPEAWLEVHDAMARLAETDEQLERIAELRLFGGLSHEEIASCLTVSLRTVERGWRSARAFLMRVLDGA